MIRPLLHVSILAALCTPTIVPAYAQTAPRVVNTTTDSAPGWIPSIDQERAALAAMQSYFAAIESGRYRQAYDAMTQGNRDLAPYVDFERMGADFRTAAGALIERRVLKVTWTKDPANAPYPGVYAAIDVSARYSKVDRQCGYIILYQAPAGGSFAVMRTENNFMANADAVGKPSADIARAWAALSMNCPNYRP